MEAEENFAQQTLGWLKTNPGFALKEETPVEVVARLKSFKTLVFIDKKEDDGRVNFWGLMTPRTTHNALDVRHLRLDFAGTNIWDKAPIGLVRNWEEFGLKCSSADEFSPSWMDTKKRIGEKPTLYLRMVDAPPIAYRGEWPREDFVCETRHGAAIWYRVNDRGEFDIGIYAENEWRMQDEGAFDGQGYRGRLTTLEIRKKFSKMARTLEENLLFFYTKPQGSAHERMHTISKMAYFEHLFKEMGEFGESLAKLCVNEPDPNPDTKTVFVYRTKAHALVGCIMQQQIFPILLTEI